MKEAMLMIAKLLILMCLSVIFVDAQAYCAGDNAQQSCERRASGRE